MVILFDLMFSFIETGNHFITLFYRNKIDKIELTVWRERLNEKTKIICTMGPSTDKGDVMEQLV
mgnify:CR=1 FL=1